MEKGVVDEAEGLTEQRKALALARVRLHEQQMEMVLQVSQVSSRPHCHRHRRPSPPRRRVRCVVLDVDPREIVRIMLTPKSTSREGARQYDDTGESSQ